MIAVQSYGPVAEIPADLRWLHHASSGTVREWLPHLVTRNVMYD